MFVFCFFFFFFCFFFFNDTATTEIYTLSLHDALPIWSHRRWSRSGIRALQPARADRAPRSEEHTSELQSHHDLVCRLLLEKKKKKQKKQSLIEQQHNNEQYYHNFSGYAGGAYRFTSSSFAFFFNDTATTEIYTLSLHDALPTSADRAP